MAKIEKLRDETYKDVMRKLKATGKCVIVRPCSFGKTVMATRIVKNYKKVLFLYPADCIKNTLSERYGDDIENVTFMTYLKLTRLSESDMLAMDYDLIFADEVHRAGAEKTSIAFRKLLSILPVHVVGATATVERMDGFDVVQEFFNGITVEPYTLHDAIYDKIIKRPYYCFCSYGLKEDIDAAIQKIDKAYLKGEDADKTLLQIADSNLMEIANIHSMENIIRKTCDTYASTTNYMKFISFFLKIEELKNNIDMIAGWFKAAYPEHNIRILEVHTETKGNVIMLEKLQPMDKTIDIIFSCDMLNEGYHVENLTGIIMCRKTVSNRIYIQQLGRVLSSDQISGGQIVFDVVDNLHRKSLFGEKSRIEEDFINDSNYNENKDNSETLLAGENNANNSENRNQPSYTGGPSLYFYEEEKPWYLNANHIDRMDIESIGNEAEYTDLIIKTILEPIENRVNDAMNKYYSLGGKKYRTRKELMNHRLDCQKLQASARMFHITFNSLVAKMESEIYNGK